ncbi:hypothetical protein [Sphingobium nicotianae]|uniref:Uncharacterized protein n=1 Tax=Sphingobium nicotianae TaxID=2782607 RepID=A0A9X1DCI4_9SPHN|nr:hypothetical protein [Sphingobium nicotianae]MBT2187359.1 hypothetical protein [Sphingobium nicotianae]
MSETESDILPTLGLGGDGDEIDAVRDVERALGVEIDCSNAEMSRTVGDVYDAAKAALPDDQRNASDLWSRFATAISYQTDVDPTRLAPETLLLADRKPRWPMMLVAIGIGLAIAVYQNWK